MFDFCKLRSNHLTLTQAAAPAVCPCGGFQYNLKGSTALPINETRATTFVPRVRAADLAEVPPEVATANSLHQKKKHFRSRARAPWAETEQLAVLRAASNQTTKLVLAIKAVNTRGFKAITRNLVVIVCKRSNHSLR